MAQQVIDVGPVANLGGDPLRTALIKINTMMTELYAATGLAPVAAGALNNADLVPIIQSGVLVQTSVGALGSIVNGLAPLKSNNLSDMASAPSCLGNLGGVSTAGFRNKVVNGGFILNTHSYVSGTALATTVRGHDSWFAGAGGCTYTFAQLATATMITITAGTLQQNVDGNVIEGGQYQVSWSGSSQCRVNGGTLLSSPINLTGMPANTNINLEFSTGTLGTVQVEPGGFVHTFEYRPFALELQIAAHYIQVWSQITYRGYGLAGAHTILPVPFIGMRGNPAPQLLATTQTNCSGLAATVSGGGAYGQGQVHFDAIVTANGMFTWATDVILYAEI